MDPTITQVTHKGRVFTPYIQKEKIQEAVQKVADEISNDLRDKNPLFITILNGAFIFCSDLLRRLDFHQMDIEFCKVSSYVGTGTSSAQSVQKLIGLNQAIKDRHVVIVEDTIDSGLTMDYLIKDLQKEGPKSISLCAMFFKKANLQVELDVKYVGMTIDPEFVIGYGLDYDEWGRNINGLWINK